MHSVESSKKLLQARWVMDAEAVAIGSDQAHDEISISQYNDKNSLSGTINLTFYYAKEYYTIIRELLRGKGFADIYEFNMKKPPNQHIQKCWIRRVLSWFIAL